MTKGLAIRPGLICLKKIGLPIKNKILKEIKNKIGNESKSSEAEINRSNKRFIIKESFLIFLRKKERAACIN
jgi:hypothetical protein